VMVDVDSPVGETNDQLIASGCLLGLGMRSLNFLFNSRLRICFPWPTRKGHRHPPVNAGRFQFQSVLGGQALWR